MVLDILFGGGGIRSLSELSDSLSENIIPLRLSTIYLYPRPTIVRKVENKQVKGEGSRTWIMSVSYRVKLSSFLETKEQQEILSLPSRGESQANAEQKRAEYLKREVKFSKEKREKVFRKVENEVRRREGYI